MFIGVSSCGWAEGKGLSARHTQLDSLLTISKYVVLLNSQGMGINLFIFSLLPLETKIK